jgi:hypothetical protein
MGAPERFVNYNTNQPLALTNATNSVFGASGASHSVGLVPDPGSSAGTTKFLNESGSFETIGAGAGLTVDVGLIIDGGGAVILSGQKGQVHIPFPITITEWSVMADQSGSIVIDVLRANNGVPISSIVGAGTAPNLSSAQYAQAAPANWTSVALATNDWIAFNVTGTPSSVTRVTIALTGTRTG